VGKGAGLWSFIHVLDTADAATTALDRGAPGVYNIVDADSAPAAGWVPHLAEVARAKPPLHVPVWAGRLAAGGGCGVHDDPGPRYVEQQGQGGAGLGSSSGEVA
jgi:nucleoside-diphosphate-sugar epimerase